MSFIPSILLTSHVIWTNVFFYLFVASVLISIILLLRAMVMLRRKIDENKFTQQQHAAKIDILRKEHADTLEKIRQEMLKREEERSRQWYESEKETLNVLNGVSTLLELNEKLGQIETDKIISKNDEILSKLGEIQSKLSKIIVRE